MCSRDEWLHAHIQFSAPSSVMISMFDVDDVIDVDISTRGVDIDDDAHVDVDVVAAGCH